MKTQPIIHFALAALFAPSFAMAQAPAAYEQGAILKASDFFPAEALKGPSYRFRDRVETDGYMATFEMDTDFGVFTAVGFDQAQKRIVEAEAIRKLVETSKSDLFAEGLKRSIEQPIDAVKNIVTKPVTTLKKAPSTVGHFFGKIGSSIERGVNKIEDRNKDGGTGASAQEVGSSVGNAAGNALGFDKAKLDTAKQLGVDPYSDNARLQDEMNKVTWAFFAGGLPLRIGAAVASAGVTLAATNMVGIPEDVYALTQTELALRDQTALENMKVPSDDIRAFMIHQSLSTTRRHVIVTHLQAMPKVDDRSSIITLANQCQSAEQADFLISALGVLARQQGKEKGEYARLKIIGRLPAAVTKTGELLVPAPVDYVTWTEQVAGFAQRDDLGDAQKILMHTGKLSAAATAGFDAAGWKRIAIDYATQK